MFSPSLVAVWLLILGWFMPTATVRAPMTEQGDVATTTALVIQVIDGDTIVVQVDTGRTAHVRYIGINTPETYPVPECGGASSTARNRALVLGKTVTLVAGPELSDKYGRRLAYVYVGDTFVNRTLITEGWAEPMAVPPNTAYRATFEILAESARHRGDGIWVCPNEEVYP